MAAGEAWIALALFQQRYDLLLVLVQKPFQVFSGLVVIRTRPFKTTSHDLGSQEPEFRIIRELGRADGRLAGIPVVACFGTGQPRVRVVSGQRFSTARMLWHQLPGKGQMFHSFRQPFDRFAVLLRGIESLGQVVQQITPQQATDRIVGELIHKSLLDNHDLLTRLAGQCSVSPVLPMPDLVRQHAGIFQPVTPNVGKGVDQFFSQFDGTVQQLVVTIWPGCFLLS